MSACEHTSDPEPELIIRNDCSWVKPIQPSERTFAFLAENIEDPTVRADVDQLLAHNESYGKFCDREANPGD